MKAKIIKSDFSGLNTFVKGIQEFQNLRVHVGVLGDHNARNAVAAGHEHYKGMRVRKVSGTEISPKTNADIGAAMEFGVVSQHIPPRSWLEMPLRTLSSWIMQKATVDMKPILKEGKPRLALKRIGVLCENAIQAAFASRGLGQWAPNAPSTIERKGSDSPLIDTAQLRRSVSSRVVTV